MARKIITCIVLLTLVFSLTGCGFISAEDIESLTSELIDNIEQQTSSEDSGDETDSEKSPFEREYFSEVPYMPKPREALGFHYKKYEDETYTYSLPYDTELSRQLFLNYVCLFLEEDIPIDMPTEVPCFTVYETDRYGKKIVAVVAMKPAEFGYELLICFNEEVLNMASNS